jgi:hypothetical protein
MKININAGKWLTLSSVVGLGLMFSGTASATLILCDDLANNHMYIDDSQVSACIEAGVGNISGNPATDDFLLGGGTADGWTLASKDDASNPFNIVTTQANGTGTWSIDPSYWSTNTMGALGFKFGTGNQPDEWFIFDLVFGVSSGSWIFEHGSDVRHTGGGLSHTNLYTKGGDNQVPEPGTLALLGAGLFGIGLMRRRRKV